MDPATRRSEWDPEWTGEEILETSGELAEVERLASDAAGDAPLAEGSDVELVARVEGRDDRDEGIAEPEPAAHRESPEDAETYAVGPELDLLLGLAEDGARDEEPDDAGEVLWFDAWWPDPRPVGPTRA